jgi:hypothetical protein
MRKHKPVSQFYLWVHSEIGILYDIGRFKDGKIHNPKGYPEEVVIKALNKALEQILERRSEAAKKAAVTRKRRHDKLVHEMAKKIIVGHKYGPRNNCALCGRKLTDQESIQRASAVNAGKAFCLKLKKCGPRLKASTGPQHDKGNPDNLSRREHA